MNLALNYTLCIFSGSGLGNIGGFAASYPALTKRLANGRFRRITLPGLQNFDLQNLELLEVPI